MADPFVYAGDKVPIGGTPGQVLTKTGAPHYYTAWRDLPAVSGGGGGSGLTSSLTFNNSGTGSSSGASFDGSIAIVVSYNTIGAASSSQTMHVGTTALAINRASANLALAGITSIAMPGSSSGTLTIQPSAATGSAVITFPAVSGTVITTGDSGTITGAMIANNTITNANINNSAAIAYSKLASMTPGQVLIGNSGSIPTPTSVTGDIAIDGSGLTSITAGVIVNADINASAAIAYSKLSLSSGIVNTDISASAAIAYSKLASLTAGNIILGNASNVATSTAVTGDIGITSAGVTAIASGVIVNADISASAAIAYSKLASMTAGHILLGNASNVPTVTAVSGDVTISSAGVTTIGAGKVTNAMLAGSIDPVKITGTAMTVSGFAAGNFDGILDEGSY